MQWDHISGIYNIMGVYMCREMRIGFDNNKNGKDKKKDQRRIDHDDGVIYTQIVYNVYSWLSYIIKT